MMHAKIMEDKILQFLRSHGSSSVVEISMAISDSDSKSIKSHLQRLTNNEILNIHIRSDGTVCWKLNDREKKGIDWFDWKQARAYYVASYDVSNENDL